MAKTTYVDILPELEEAYFSGVKSSDRFVFSRIIRKTSLLSVKKKKGLTIRSLLPQITQIWNGFSAIQKQAWSNAAAKSGLNGYRLFVQDQSLRIKNELPGVAIPSLLHQSFVGQIHIGEPASELQIIQTHPHFYWISKKVTGKKGMYKPVLITEDLALDFKISFNYKSELEVAGGENFAKFYARFWHSYQGADQYADFEIPIDYVSGWKEAEATVSLLGVIPFGDSDFGSESELLGYYIRYDLFFHLKGLTGDLYIDNIKIEHSGQNWARDTYCKDINQGFTRAFYQIPKHWAGVIVPDGSWYESIYKDF